MSAKKRSPESNKSIKGSDNQVIQGDGNQQGNHNKSNVWYIFSFNGFSVFGSLDEKIRNLIPNWKNWRKQKWWMLVTFAIMTLLVIILVFPDTIVDPSIPNPKNASSSEGISLGEEILIEQNIPNKQELETAFSEEDYQQVRNLLGDYLKQNPNSPELWVYRNNATAALLTKKPIKIAVSIPIGTNQDVAEEILRGVALAQKKFNDDLTQNGINGRLLQVVIANDKNESKLAEKVAEKFVEDTSILAVVGHNASNASLAAKEIYKDKLVMITPTSFSDKIQGDSYIFRMVPQISYFANKLARYIERQNPNAIVGTCVDPSTPDNDSFITQFDAVFSHKTFNLSCDFLDKGLTNASSDKAITNIIEEIKQHKINSVVLAPYIERMSQMFQIFQAIHDNNLSIQLYGSPTFFTQKTLDTNKIEQTAEGLTLSVPWYPDQNQPENVKFQEQFLQIYQDKIDNWRTAMAYDATWIIVTGLEQISEEKQQIGRKELNDVLIAPEFIHDGATGKTEFSDSGVNENQHDVLIQIKDGQFIKIDD
jgi:branched-chain amino acid transport system substrate-binding protein